MFKHLLALFTLTLSFECFAEITVEHDWSFERNTWIRYDYKSGGFFGIGATRKVFDETHTWRAPLRVLVSGENNSVLKTGTVGSSGNAQAFRLHESCRYPEDMLNLECLYLENKAISLKVLSVNPFAQGYSARAVSTNRMSEVTTKIEDNKLYLNVKDYLFSDRKGIRYMKFLADKIFGKVKINLPLDNKFISFQKKIKMSGIFNPQFNQSLVHYQGSNFKSRVDINTRDKWETVWTLPGKTNYVEFNIGLAHGLGLSVINDQWVDIGEYEVEIADLNSMVNVNVFDSETGSFEGMQKFLDDLVIVPQSSPGLLLNYRDQLLKLVSSDDFKQNVFASYSLGEISELLKSLNVVGLQNYLEPKDDTGFSYLGWDIKTATYILAIDIAKDSISKLDPFCKELNYKTSDGQSKKISGINIASFYLSRAISRLNNFKFNEFTYLFTYMNDLNSIGMTFSQVRSDKDKIQKIRDVVELLKDSNVLKKSPFGVAYTELNDVYNNFGDVNGRGTKLSDVITQLKDTELEVDDLRKEIMTRLRTFQPDNHQVVDFSDLEDRVEVVSLDLRKLSKDLDNVFGINSKVFESSGSNEDSRKQFIRFLVEVLTNYLSVFDEMSGDLSIDSFLKEYKDHYKIDEMKERFKSCLPI